MRLLRREQRLQLGPFEVLVTKLYYIVCINSKTDVPVSLDGFWTAWVWWRRLLSAWATEVIF